VDAARVTLASLLVWCALGAVALASPESERESRRAREPASADPRRGRAQQPAPRRPGMPPSCALPVIRPRGGSGWHKVQYALEDAYCGLPAGGLHRSILRSDARQVTENHRAGALFTLLLAEGEAAAVRSWLAEQIASGHQGAEQGGGYTNYYRADVLAGLRWGSERGDSELVRLATTWLEQSYALDLLHAVPGTFAVAIPCSRHKPVNLDGREVALSLLAGVTDPREVLALRRWQYPAYDDVRWLADALLEGRLETRPWMADWALRRDARALARLRESLAEVRLRSTLVWVLVDSGGWYSFAAEGIGAAPPPAVDAVAVTAQGDVQRVAWQRNAGDGAEVRVGGGRLSVSRHGSERSLALPAGEATLRLELGRGEPPPVAARP
jgi:hypothetical protein